MSSGREDDRSEAASLADAELTNEPDDTGATDPPGDGGTRALVLRAIVAVILGIALLASGIAIGRAISPGEIYPDTLSAEAGFLRDMQTHHAQGVELTRIVRDSADDEDLRLIAWDMLTVQSSQLGWMYGLLVSWGLPQLSPVPEMSWMSLPPIDGSDGSHSHGWETGEPMPGLATEEQLRELASLDGVEAEIRFLELMIDHHLGGVEMAEAVLARSTQYDVTLIAESIASAQQAEIDLMEHLLAERS